MQSGGGRAACGARLGRQGEGGAWIGRRLAFLSVVGPRQRDSRRPWKLLQLVTGNQGERAEVKQGGPCGAALGDSALGSATTRLEHATG